MSDDNYLQTQQMLQSIFFDALDKEAETNDYLLNFIIDTLGGLSASMCYNVLEWDDKNTEQSDEEKIVFMATKIMERFSDVMAGLRGQESTVTIVPVANHNDTRTLN